MKNMTLKIANKIIVGFALTAAISTSIAGCSKDKKSSPEAKKISMKITVKAVGADANDQVDFAVIAGNHDASQYGSEVWKLNATTQGNQNSVLLDVGDFTGTTKTYVLETVKSVDFGSLSFNVSNLDGAPITVSYKAEINGVVETNVENQVFTAGQSQNKNFQYVGK